MMEGLLVISDVLTNGLRLALGLCLLARLMDVRLDRRTAGIAVLESVLATVLELAGLPAAGVIAAEVAIALAAVRRCLREQLRMCLFLMIFYEMGTALWEFLISAALALLFHSARFMDEGTIEHAVSVWLFRLLLAVIAVLLIRTSREGKSRAFSLASVVAVLGVFGVIALSEQTVLPLDSGQFITWTIFSILLMLAVLLYRLNRQYELETEVARLREEQAEIRERDYQTLSRTYDENARLYHDFHNHIEAIYQCLRQGELDTALAYCEDLRGPVREISQAVWTGDKTTDYLIGSKLALAGRLNVKTMVNIEYPHNTNIRSVDMTAILGNLLDNALEAAAAAPEELRFLNLTVRRIHEMLMIKVENGCREEPVLQGGELQTTKEDKRFHGWGIKSVLAAAQRYEGAVETEFAEGVFRAVVTLSYHPVKRKSCI